MRKYLIVLFCAVVALSACEVIPDGERFDPVGKIESRRVVLLEEFTGVQCTNCPAAAKVAQSLLSEYPDNLVVVGLHGRNTGDFGKPFENEQDFRISDVEAYYDEFGPTDGYPCGMVNRATPEKPNRLYYALQAGCRLLRRRCPAKRARQRRSNGIRTTGRKTGIRLSVTRQFCRRLQRLLRQSMGN